MKKILCIILCLFLLGGCTDKAIKEEPEALVVSGFRSLITTSLNGLEVSAQAEVLSLDNITVTLVSPNTVKDMKFSYINGEYEVQYKGFDFGLSLEALPLDNIIENLKSCLNSVQGKLPNAEKAGESLTYSYTDNGYGCTLYVNAETNAFERVTVGNTDVLVFENFEYIYETN